MDPDAPRHGLMRALAEEISLGGDVDQWAKSTMVCAVTVREWTERPEFRELVEACRVEHAERMVGKIARRVERAIERLVEISERSRNLSVSLAATKAIIENWVALTVHFVQERTYQSLCERPEGDSGGSSGGEAGLVWGRAVRCAAEAFARGVCGHAPPDPRSIRACYAAITPPDPPLQGGEGLAGSARGRRGDLHQRRYGERDGSHDFREEGLRGVLVVVGADLHQPEERPPLRGARSVVQPAMRPPPPPDPPFARGGRACGESSW